MGEAERDEVRKQGAKIKAELHRYLLTNHTLDYGK